MKQENPMLMAETLQGEMQEDEVMSEEQLQGVISAEIYDAISFIDDDIGGNRALATEYYYGQAFGDDFTDPRSGEQIEYPLAPGGSAAMVINCRCSYIVVPKRDSRGQLIRT